MAAPNDDPTPDTDEQAIPDQAEIDAWRAGQRQWIRTVLDVAHDDPRPVDALITQLVEADLVARITWPTDPPDQYVYLPDQAEIDLWRGSQRQWRRVLIEMSDQGDDRVSALIKEYAKKCARFAEHQYEGRKLTHQGLVETYTSVLRHLLEEVIFPDGIEGADEETP